MIATIFITLFSVSVLYAWLLSRNDWYIPDWTWVPVVGWALLVLAALYAIAIWVGPTAVEMVFLTFWAMFDAAIPLVVWQLNERDQRLKNRAKRGG